jgi:hypothetical protein
MRPSLRALALLACLPVLNAAMTFAVEQPATSTLESALAPDGTLLPDARGSFDARGWRLETGQDGAPRFVTATSADKAGCGEGWDNRFTLRGTDAQVTGLAVIGSDVYACGTFGIAGTDHFRLARWDGTNWSDVGTGVNNQVDDFAVDGTDLYASGFFTVAGGVDANRIARWDGTNWSALGTGFTGATISALTMWNGDLYAAGSFTAAGGVAANRIARWDGTAWSPLGDGLNNSVYALAADAGGLYAAGNFTASGATALNRIARWDGSAWTPLGAGLNNITTALFAADGNLYASGSFTTAGSVNANRIARWDGTSWFAMGSGVSSNAARAFAVLNGELYVGGSFDYAGGIYSPKLARWNGTSWSAVGESMTGTGAPSVDAMAVMSDGLGGGNLFVGGVFRTADTLPVKNIARYDGMTWHALGEGQAPDNTVWEVGVGIDAEGGKVIYAGGLFLQAGSTAAKYVAAWDVDAGTWKTLGTGVNGEVRTVATNGTDLYVGGVFTIAGIYNAYNVAHWDGTQWTRLGTGTNAKVEILELCPNGAGGTDLYAGGGFTMAGGVAANRIAKWNGTAWSALGAGCNAWVESIAFADNGAGGYDVYAGGQFTTAGGLPATGIAKWDGSTWSAVGGGLTATGTGFPAIAEELFVASDGADGLSLYVGGLFTAAGGQPINHIARWDGTTWHPLGTGLEWAAFGLDMRDGLLHVGGNFTTAGGVAVNGLATWDGSSWAAYAGNAPVQTNMVLLDGDDLYICGAANLNTCVTSYNFAHHTRTVTSDVDPRSLPSAAGILAQNAPNPFNPQTEIAFRLDRNAHTVLRVYDARGRAVTTLVDGDMAAGDHTVHFDGKGLASGLYVYRLEIDGVAQARKMMLVR